MNRQEAIDAVSSCVLKDRNNIYGHPEDNFLRVARLWKGYLNIDFAPHDVAVMMALLKIARITANPSHADSWVDLAGYAVCGAEICTSGS